MARRIARVLILERHADGSARQFWRTRVVDDSTTVRELFDWLYRKVNDPLNGEFATREIVLTPDGEDE